MQRHIFFCIFVLVFTCECKAQFFGLLRKDPQNLYTTTLSYPQDGKYRVFNLRYPSLTDSRFKCQILVFNTNLILVDSINMLTNASPQLQEPLRFGNKLLWPSVFSDSLSFSSFFPLTQSAVLVLDTNYHYISIKKLSALKNSALMHCKLQKSGPRLFLGYADWNAGNSTIYKLDTAFTKIDSVSFNGIINEIGMMNNKLVITGFGLPLPCIDLSGGRIEKLEMDTSLNILNCLTFDSLTTFQAPDLSFSPKNVGLRGASSKIIPISNTKYFVAGTDDLDYYFSSPGKTAIINGILDKNNKVIKTALFTNTLNNVTYLGQTNFVSVVGNEIVTVGCIGHNPSFLGMAQPQKARILVNKMDTLGNVLWAREFGGDMYYRPHSIIKTLDGGYLIAGLRYDSTKNSMPGIMESFLLKLDGNGSYNALSIIKNGLIENQKIRYFPNPANNSICFDAPFEEVTSIEMFDNLGKLVLKKEDYLNLSAIDINFLPIGFYYYKIETRLNNYSGKFLKE